MWVFGGSLGAFFAVLAGLGFQAQAPAEAAPGAQRESRQIVVRRVIKTVVVHHRATRQPASRPPATWAPAAPAPAPAPAPLTTQSS